jgi:hypothetical protein
MPSVKPRIYFHADSDVWDWYSRLDGGMRAKIMNELIRKSMAETVNEIARPEELAQMAEREVFSELAAQRLQIELHGLQREFAERVKKIEQWVAPLVV